MSGGLEPSAWPEPRGGGGDAEPSRVRPPEPARLFELRAARFAALAPGHALPEWLRLLSRIAAGQAAAVRVVPATPPPLQPGPPLAFDTLPRDDAWRRMLPHVLAAARGPGLPAATEDALRALGGLAPAGLERIADAVLGGDLGPDQLAAAPFVGAALQAWLTALAAGVEAPAPGPGGGACPACGGPPVAGRIRRNDRLRDVTCALCATEWNVPRVRCVMCDTSAGPEYFHVDAEPGVKAEACPTCRSYVKLVDEEKRAGAEPAADDAATLALDLLLAEEGFHRAGPNLYLGG